VLQEVPDDLRAMREIGRVVKPGGWAILQVPLTPVLDSTLEDKSELSPSERRRKFGSTRHVRIYGRDYIGRLSGAGLAARATHPVREGWCKDAGKFATIPEEEIYIVRKGAA
jgi:hypothetical protein